MRKEIILIASITLAMTGCAQKKLNTTVDTSAIDTSVVTSGPNGTNTGAYANVDPIGQGMGQGSGIYGQDGIYGQNGTYGQNGSYSENNGYGNSGVSNIYFDVNQYHITADKLSEISHKGRSIRFLSFFHKLVCKDFREGLVHIFINERLPVHLRRESILFDIVEKD